MRLDRHIAIDLARNISWRHLAAPLQEIQVPAYVTFSAAFIDAIADADLSFCHRLGNLLALMPGWTHKFHRLTLMVLLFGHRGESAFAFFAMPSGYNLRHR